MFPQPDKIERIPGCIADAHKFYNTVLATERDQHLKRIWWSPSVDVEPKVYLTRVVNFGEKTAGTMPSQL